METLRHQKPDPGIIGHQSLEVAHSAVIEHFDRIPVGYASKTGSFGMDHHPGLTGLFPEFIDLVEGRVEEKMIGRRDELQTVPIPAIRIPQRLSVRERIEAKLHVGRMLDASADQAASQFEKEIRQLIDEALESPAED